MQVPNCKPLLEGHDLDLIAAVHYIVGNLQSVSVSSWNFACKNYKTEEKEFWSKISLRSDFCASFSLGEGRGGMHPSALLYIQLALPTPPPVMCLPINKCSYTYGCIFGRLHYKTKVTTTTDLHLPNELVFVTHEPDHSFFCQFPFLFTGEWKYCLLHK